METTDRELINRYMKVDARLKKLYQEHQTIEGRLLKFANRTFLTNQEAVEEKQLKQKKLKGVDRMLIIAREHASEG